MGGGREVGTASGTGVRGGAHLFMWRAAGFLCGRADIFMRRPGGYFFVMAGRIFRWKRPRPPGRMEENMSRVGIIGGGAAGMMAAVAAGGRAARRCIFSRKMRSWGRRSTSREKGAAT